MIYFIVRQFCKFVLRFFTKKIEVEGIENLPKSGPIVFASNHPNSFLDAIVINCKIDRPTWSLARGDAFKKPWAKAILSKFFMMPIYRISEGKEYLQKNDETFEKCFALFKNNQQVLIFSEGICTNQTALLPLKKGTARLVQQVWQTDLPLQVVPVGLSYNDYSSFGKNIKLVIGKPIFKDEFDNINTEGVFLRTFNETLNVQLQNLAHRPLDKPSFIDSPLYYLGLVLNFPLNFILTNFVRSKTKGTVFYDSVVYGLMVALLPIYWGVLFLILRLIF